MAANIPVLMYLRRTVHCSFLSIFCGIKKFGWLWSFTSIIVSWFILIFVRICFGFKFQWMFPNGDQYIIIFLLIVTITAQSFVEEVIFRGYLSKAIYISFRRVMAVFVSVPIMFTLYHLEFTLVLFLLYLEGGIFFSYLAMRTGGLQLSTAVHVAINAFAVLGGNFVAPVGRPNILLLQTIALMAMAFLLEAGMFVARTHRSPTA